MWFIQLLFHKRVGELLSVLMVLFLVFQPRKNSAAIDSLVEEVVTPDMRFYWFVKTA